MSTFGAAIRKARISKKLSLRVLAELIGVNFTYLSKIENEDMAPPSIEKIQALAKYLQLDPDYLYGLAKRLPEELIEVAVEPEVPAILRAVKDLSVDQKREILDYITSHNKPSSEEE